jgi:hypothetical protein
MRLTIIEPMFDRTKAIATIEVGRCPCPGCRGELTDANLSPRSWRHCKSCRCAHKAQTITGTVYACRIEGSIHTRPRVPNRRLTEADFDGHEDLL